MKAARLVVRGLGRRCGPQARWLYRGLDLDLGVGRVTAVVGPNGSGKSTFLRDLVGLRRPEEGRIDLDGRSLQAWSPRARAQEIAFLPQRPIVPEELTVARLVGLGRVPHQGWWGAPTSRDKGAVEHAMRMTEVEHLAERPLHALSGGEVQRTMIARMLATEADILVLDEPTSALDLRHALHGLELLRVLAAHGCTVVLSLHELEWARRFADDALVLTEGGACICGRARDVLDPPRLETVFGVQLHTVSGGGFVAALPPSEREAMARAVRDARRPRKAPLVPG